MTTGFFLRGGTNVLVFLSVFGYNAALSLQSKTYLQYLHCKFKFNCSFMSLATNSEMHGHLFLKEISLYRILYPYANRTH